MSSNYFSWIFSDQWDYLKVPIFHQVTCDSLYWVACNLTSPIEGLPCTRLKKNFFKKV